MAHGPLRLIRSEAEGGGEGAPSLPELVLRARDGDKAAQSALCRQLYPGIASLAYRLLGDPTEAQDIAQETFVVFASQLDRLREPERVVGWLRSITVNLTRKNIRRRVRTRARFVQLDPVDIDAHFGTDGEPDKRAEVQRVYGVLAALHPEQRLAFMLREVEGLTWDEMAEVALQSVSTLKRRHRVAIAQVREALEGPRG